MLTSAEPSRNARPAMLTLLVAADIRLVREGIAQVVDLQPGLEVIGTAASTEETLTAVAERAPHIALVDMVMGRSLSTVRAILEIAPEVKVVALAVPEQEQDVIACAEAGVAGYVTREGSVDDLVAVVKSVARGEMLCSPRIAATLLRRVNHLAREARPAEPAAAAAAAMLTSRELEILELIADEALSNKQIARRLQIEVTTVKNHVHRILSKLGVERRGQAAAWLRDQRIPVGARTGSGS